MVSGVVTDVLKGVFAPLVFFDLELRERERENILKGNILKCFLVLNAVVLRNIFENIWKNE